MKMLTESESILAFTLFLLAVIFVAGLGYAVIRLIRLLWLIHKDNRK